MSRQIKIHRVAVHLSFTEAIGLSKRVQLTAFDEPGRVFFYVV